MGRPTDRLPGDPPRGDHSFGPLGGLVDDVYHDSRSRGLERDMAAAGYRAPDALRVERVSWRLRLGARLASMLDRLASLRDRLRRGP